MSVMAVNYSGGLISDRALVGLFRSGNCRYIRSPGHPRNRVTIVGAYNFVRSTGRRDVSAVLRFVRTGRRKQLHGLCIVNYLSRHCRGRLRTRVPRISGFCNGFGCGRLLGRLNGTSIPTYDKAHRLAAPRRCTCVGVSRNYGHHYTCYTVPVVANGRISHPVGRVLSRMHRLMTSNIGRFRVVTRRLACCNISLSNGRRVARLVDHVTSVPNIG